MKKRYKVIDSNIRQDSMLHDYLKASSTNYAVLTDYAGIEAYKGSGLQSIYYQMDILCNFPSQVIVLKSTSQISILKTKRAGLTRRMIDSHQTAGFARFCRLLVRAKEGDKSLQQQLLDNELAANKHIEAVLLDAATIPETFKELAKAYSSNELKIIRAGQDYSEELIDKIVRHVLLLAVNLFDKHPNIRTLPTYGELANSYIFRYALCGLLLFIKWIENGEAINIKSERIQNDLIDLSFATYGTFFDGVLTNDKKLLSIYNEAKAFLRAFEP